MSSISRLAAIAQHSAPVLRASVPARFAPHPPSARDNTGFGDAEGWDVEEQWLEQQPTVPAPSTRHDRDSDRVRGARPGPSYSDAQPAPPRPDASSAPSPTPSGSPPRADRVVEEHHHHHVVAEARVRPDTLETAPPLRPSAEPLTTAYPAEPGRPAAAQSEPPSRPSTAPVLAAAGVPQRRATPAERGAPVAASRERRAVEAPAAHDPPPPVRITIGRIEIVANRPPTAPAARPVAPARERPGPDLVAYLKDHR